MYAQLLIFLCGSNHLLSHNTATNTQRIFSEHSDDIVSLTVAPDGQTVATGQVGRDPTILVWDSTTLKVLAVLRATAQRAITSLVRN